METLIIPGGNFLVFPFQGSVAEFVKFWQHIHNEWLPNSRYQLDNRPHFEKLPSGYNPMRDDNQEEIYDYFGEAETDDLGEAYSEFDGDYTEEELRLMRIKFMSEMAN